MALELETVFKDDLIQRTALVQYFYSGRSNNNSSKKV